MAIAVSQWLFNKDELKRTPSTQAGHDAERERVERMKGCDFILKVGFQLRLPQTTVSTACVFLHRFYMRFALKEYHYYDIAATSLFLATKCEETGRKLKDIVIACARTAQKKPDAVIDEQSKDYWSWRDTILYNEELLLEALCFDLIIEHPYALIKDHWQRFSGQKELAKVAWVCASDTYRTTTCLIYGINTIAVSCLYIASVFSKIPIEDIDGKKWYEALDIEPETIAQMVMSMVDFYQNAQQNLKDGYDPKLMAEAGTEALRLLRGSPPAEAVGEHDHEVAEEKTNGHTSPSPVTPAIPDPQPDVTSSNTDTAKTEGTQSQDGDLPPEIEDPPIAKSPPEEPTADDDRPSSSTIQNSNITEHNPTNELASTDTPNHPLAQDNQESETGDVSVKAVTKANGKRPASATIKQVGGKKKKKVN